MLDNIGALSPPLVQRLAYAPVQESLDKLQTLVAAVIGFALGMVVMQIVVRVGVF